MIQFGDWHKQVEAWAMLANGELFEHGPGWDISTIGAGQTVKVGIRIIHTAQNFECPVPLVATPIFNIFNAFENDRQVERYYNFGFVAKGITFSYAWLETTGEIMFKVN